MHLKETMEEEDPLILEITVLLSKALSDNIYVYQYPGRPSRSDWNGTKVVNSRIKPQNRQVTLEFGIDTYSDKYCGSKGEQIALNTDGNHESSRYMKDKEREKAQYFKTGTMDKMVYESLAPAIGNNYVISLLQDKEFHWTPISGIVQMRPSYSYFDKQDTRAKEMRRPDNSEDEEEDDVQQVTVSFARQETDYAKKAREKSFEFMSRRNADEAWCDTVWRHADTDHADLERLKLFCPNSSTGTALRLPPREYLLRLVPSPPSEETDAPESRDLRGVHLPLVDQCRALLKEVKLISYSEIGTLVRAGGAAPPEQTALLAALNVAGCCVRGLWAVRSSDLYQQPSGAAGVPAAVMCAARDYVLYLFTQSPCVDRRKVTAAVRLPDEEVLEILATVAKYNPHTGWELMHPPDVGFESTFPDVVQRQNLYWEGKQRQFNETLLGEPAVPKRQRKRSQRESFSSDSSKLSPKPRCNSVSAHTDEDSDGGRKKQKNKPGAATGKRTRNLSVGSESAS